MTKRSIAAVILVAAILLIPSCDAETFLRKFGTNVLGGYGATETIKQIDEKVDLIISGDEDPENTSYDELVSLVVQATRNPDTETKMLDSLSKKTEEAAATIEREINAVIDEVNENMTDANLSFDDFANNIEQIKEDINESKDIPDNLKGIITKAADNIKTLVDAVNGTGTYVPTKGDVVLVKTMASVAGTILNELSGESESEGISQEVIDKANEALKMYNTIRSVTVFKNLDLNSVIDELLSSSDSGSSSDEGSSEVTPDNGEVTE